MNATIAIENVGKIPSITAPVWLAITTLLERAAVLINNGCPEVEVLNGSPPVCRFPVDPVNSPGDTGSTR